MLLFKITVEQINAARSASTASIADVLPLLEHLDLHSAGRWSTIDRLHLSLTAAYKKGRIRVDGMDVEESVSSDMKYMAWRFGSYGMNSDLVNMAVTYPEKYLGYSRDNIQLADTIPDCEIYVPVDNHPIGNLVCILSIETSGGVPVLRVDPMLAARYYMRNESVDDLLVCDALRDIFCLLKANKCIISNK